MARPLPQISLQQYAGIQAALADGHPLEAVLRQEGVPEWHWPQLEMEQIDAITNDPALFDEYCVKLAEAEDCLDRKVEPLNTDLEAWSGFVAAVAADDAIIIQHDLLPGDIKRLQRRWQKRFEADAKLNKRAEKLAGDPPPPPGALDLEPAQLRAFPWSPSAQAAEASSTSEPLAFLRETASLAGSPKQPTLPFAGQRPPPPGTLEIELTPMLGQTAALAGSPKQHGSATPFEPPNKPAVEAAAIAPLAPPAMTMPRPVATAGAPFDEPRPKASDSWTHSWTPEHYGCFCAQLDAAVAQRREVLDRWGFDSEQLREAFERYWRERFKGDPSLRDRFAAALKRFRE